MNSTEHANKLLAPIIRRCAAVRGTKSEITRRMAALVSDAPDDASVGRWLDADAKTRVEPSLGIGLLLLEVGREVIAGHGTVDKPLAGRVYLLRHRFDQKWCASDEPMVTHKSTPLKREAHQFHAADLERYQVRNGRLGDWDLVEVAS